MYSIKKALTLAAFAATFCLLWCSPASGQERSTSVKKKTSAPARISQQTPPSTPASGGGSSEKTEEEAERMLKAGEKYKDPNPVSGPNVPRRRRRAGRVAN